MGFLYKRIFFQNIFCFISWSRSFVLPNMHFWLFQLVNALKPSVAYLYPLKTSENLRGIDKQHWAVMGECDAIFFP